MEPEDQSRAELIDDVDQRKRDAPLLRVVARTLAATARLRRSLMIMIMTHEGRRGMREARSVNAIENTRSAR
jgi:hypothetical protein